MPRIPVTLYQQSKYEFMRTSFKAPPTWPLQGGRWEGHTGKEQSGVSSDGRGGLPKGTVGPEWTPKALKTSCHPNRHLQERCLAQ